MFKSVHLYTCKKGENMKYIGLDIHKTFCQGAVIDKQGKIISEEKIPTKRKSIIELINRYPGSKVVMESTGVWEYIYDCIESCGTEVILSNPLKTRMIAEAKIKTDKVDALILAHLLRSDMIPTSYVPEKEIRNLRKDVRERGILKKVSTSIKNHIYAEFLRNGIEYDAGVLCTKKGRKWA